MALAPTLADRIVAHLAAFPIEDDANDVPREVTQEGIADALSARVAHVSRGLKALVAQGLVRAHLAHPVGGVRRARAHALTDAGRARARSLPPVAAERPRAPPVEAAAPARAVRPPAGRAKEFAALLDALDAAKAKGPRFALVEGDAGVGRSRLLDALGAEAERRGWRALSAAGAPVGAEQLIGPIGPALAPLGFERRFRARDAGTPRERALAAASETLASAAREQPVLVLLDDLHYAGQSVVDFLRGLLLALPHGARVLVVASIRRLEAWQLPNGPLYAALAPLRAEPFATHVDIGPLSRDGVADLLSDAGIHVLGEKTLPAEVVDRVWRESGGNPMFALAMGQELADGVDEDDFFPPVVKAAAKEHFAALPEAALSVLQTAAVAGVDVAYETLRRAAEAKEDDLVRQLDVLLDRLLLEEVPGHGDVKLRFRHPKVRDAVLADLSASRRRWIESRVADAHQA